MRLNEHFSFMRSNSKMLQNIAHVNEKVIVFAILIVYIRLKDYTTIKLQI